MVLAPALSTSCMYLSCFNYLKLLQLLQRCNCCRGTSRRIQNMGFVRDRATEGLWMTLNGGAMQQTTQQPDGTTDPVFDDVSIKSGGYGIIDVAWKVGAGETFCCLCGESQPRFTTDCAGRFKYTFLGMNQRLSRRSQCNGCPPCHALLLLPLNRHFRTTTRRGPWVVVAAFGIPWIAAKRSNSARAPRTSALTFTT